MADVRRLLVIGGKRRLLDKVRDLDIELWHLQSPSEFDAEAPPTADVTLVHDYVQQPRRGVQRLKELHAAFPFSAAGTTNENALLFAADLRRQLALKGASARTTSLMTDKYAMRQLLNRRGVSPVRAALVQAADDVDVAIALTGLPAIIKPIAGLGSLSVERVDTRAEFLSAARRFVEAGLTPFLAEEYLDGHEVSVETFSFGGTHICVTVTAKITGEGYLELGHSLPAQVAPGQHEEIVALVGRFLHLVGLKDGPAHTEVKLTSDGLRIVESHPRRGGDRISELVDCAYGFDLERLTFAWPLGLAAPLAQSPAANGGAAIQFMTAEPGVVTTIEGVDVAKALPGVEEVYVTYDAGQYLPKPRWSSERAGFVRACARTPEEAAAICQQAVAAVRITTAPAGAATTGRGLAHFVHLDQSRLLGYGRE